MTGMARTVIGTLVVGLALIFVAARSDAQLGCSPAEGSNPPVAICSVAPDCAPVGGIDCTGGACFCPEGDFAPFCACLSTAPTAGAPVVSGAGLIALIGILCAIGLLGLWRRTGREHAAT
jgi:hypothetical protein